VCLIQNSTRVKNRSGDSCEHWPKHISLEQNVSGCSEFDINRLILLSAETVAVKKVGNEFALRQRHVK